MDGSLDLVLCMTQFDDSRMFDLLRMARERLAGIPFVGCDVATSALSRGTLRAVEIAAVSQGAMGFINLPALRKRHGGGAEAMFRRLVMDCLRTRSPRPTCRAR